MSDWMDGMRKAIAYMEEHMTEPMDVQDIAAQAHLSGFYFQRIFAALSGVTVGEYIRNRRLSLAAQELSTTEQKVIDVAVKYGYDSPDSFARAFQRFHGISPSMARKKGAMLKLYAPLKIILTLEGGEMLEYRIEEKAAFTVIGVSRMFNADTGGQDIPKFWEEYMSAGENRAICGEFGISVNNDSQEFEYWIADTYIPCKEIPRGCLSKEFPAGTWAVFPCRGPLKDTLQSTNTRIWKEWIPNCKEYKLAGNYVFEMYTPPQEDPQKDYCELWVPVEKA